MGKVKPTPLSREYDVALTYTDSQAPRVWVIGEGLQKMDDPNFSHNYDVDAKTTWLRFACIVTANSPKTSFWQTP